MGKYVVRSDEVQLYLRRAKEFYKAMSLLDEPEFTNAAALLAIHSAISIADALRLGLGATSLASEDHSAAAESRFRLQRSRGVTDISGIQTYRYLLSRKTAVAYGSKRVDHKEVQKLTQGAERFSRWVTNAGEQLQIEGWRYADR